MRLYLVRHGQAKPKADDPERHLTEAGVAQVHRTASFLHALEPAVGQVWHSGKPRAKQTADILAAALACRPAVAERAGLGPNDKTKALVKPIEQAAGQGLMIVGHLPHLGCLAGRLLAADKDAQWINFQTAGVAYLQKPDDHWELNWLISPQVLSASLISVETS